MRPIGNHSATRMFPSRRKMAACGVMNCPGVIRLSIAFDETQLFRLRLGRLLVERPLYARIQDAHLAVEVRANHPIALNMKVAGHSQMGVSFNGADMVPLSVKV